MSKHKIGKLPTQNQKPLKQNSRGKHKQTQQTNRPKEHQNRQTPQTIKYQIPTQSQNKQNSNPNTKQHTK